MSTFAREEAKCFLNAASVKSFSGRSFSGEESLLLPTLYRAARLALGTGSFVGWVRWTASPDQTQLFSSAA
jgi:hypothetical protein